MPVSAQAPTPARPTRSTRSSTRSGRRGRGRADVVHAPLGSLTQRDHRVSISCPSCGSGHVTRLSMSLTDGTPVDFTSCHRCEHRMWQHAGSELSPDDVLDRARKL